MHSPAKQAHRPIHKSLPAQGLETNIKHGFTCKNLQDSFSKRTFVSAYHLLLNFTDMENTTQDTKKGTGLLARMRKKLTERKLRIMRLIELKRLQRIRKKTVPGYTYCKNCGTKLEGMYCHCCGQYALDIYQPFWKYLKQYFGNVYQFDSKIWQTLWLMFTRPGFLTNEFNAGKINSYVHPFRLYMCISVVFFTLFFMLASDKANQALQAIDSLNISDQVVRQLNSGTAKPDTCVYLYQDPELVKAFQKKGVTRTDTLFQVYCLDDRFSLSYVRMPQLVADSCLHESTLRQKDLKTILELKKLKSSQLDSLLRDEEITSESIQAALHFQTDSAGAALTPVYEWNQEHADEAEQLRQESFLNQLLGNLSKWTPLYMMFLLPLFAWMLQAFFRKSQYPYMWHFVHAIHLNTVFLMLIPIPLVPILTGKTFLDSFKGDLPVYTLLIFLAGMFIYTYISLHTVYHRGWIRTLVKTVVFLTVFTFIALTIAAVLLIFLLSTLSEQY